MRSSPQAQQAVLALLTQEAQPGQSLRGATGLSEISLTLVLIDLVESRQAVSYFNPATGQMEYWLPKPPQPEPSQ